MAGYPYGGVDPEFYTPGGGDAPTVKKNVGTAGNRNPPRRKQRPARPPPRVIYMNRPQSGEEDEDGVPIEALDEVDDEDQPAELAERPKGPPMADCAWCQYGKPVALGVALGAGVAYVAGVQLATGALWGGVGGALYGMLGGRRGR